jgi:hypothetical protein
MEGRRPDSDSLADLAQAKRWHLGFQHRRHLWVDGGGVSKAAPFSLDYFNESLQFGKDQSGMLSIR